MRLPSGTSGPLVSLSGKIKSRRKNGQVVERQTRSVQGAVPLVGVRVQIPPCPQVYCGQSKGNVNPKKYRKSRNGEGFEQNFCAPIGG